MYKRQGQRPLLVAQQQPLAVLAGNRRHALAAQGADEAGFADAQQATVDAALQALARMAVDGLRGTGRLAEGACDGVLRAVFQRSGQRQAGTLVEIA